MPDAQWPPAAPVTTAPILSKTRLLPAHQRSCQAQEGCPAQLSDSLQRQHGSLFPVHLNAFNSSCSTFPCCIMILPEYDAVLKNGIKCFCEMGIYFSSLNHQIKEFKHNSETPFFFFTPSEIIMNVHQEITVL